MEISLSTPPSLSLFLQPHLHEIVNRSMSLANTAKEPCNYFLLLRALFRSIGGGTKCHKYAIQATISLNFSFNVCVLIVWWWKAKKNGKPIRFLEKFSKQVLKETLPLKWIAHWSTYIQETKLCYTFLSLLTLPIGSHELLYQEFLPLLSNLLQGEAWTKDTNVWCTWCLHSLSFYLYLYLYF